MAAETLNVNGRSGEEVSLTVRTPSSEQRIDVPLALADLRHIGLVTGPVIIVPNCAACRARCASLALQISFLLGRQAILGQEPPIHFRSTTAVRRPDRAICQATFLPSSSLPRIRTFHTLLVQT